MASAAPLPGLQSTLREDVRHNVRDVLTQSLGFDKLDPETRRHVAKALVQIGSTALNLSEQSGEPPSQPPAQRPPIAQTQSTPQFGAATDRLARTTQDTLKAVSFPRFVTELITGVFKALNDSNQQQLTAFVEMIQNVAASTEGFADANVGLSGAREWLAERFPGSFRIRGGSEEEGFDNPAEMTAEERAEYQAERDAETQLELVPGGSFPSESALRLAFGIAEGEAVPTGNPESLVPLARQSLARNRQQMLATMVQMGLQRLVIESGRLNASMKFHIDTSSAANSDRGSQFDMRNTVDAAGRFGFGPWGAEAKVQNTIGYVTTERNQTSEEINTELDLDSGVELVFRTDYVPLDRLASAGDRDRIRVNTLNPEAEAERLATERTERRTARDEERATRRSDVNSRLVTPPPPPLPPPAVAPNPPNSGSGSGATPRPPAGSGSSGSSGTATGTPAPSGSGTGSPGGATGTTAPSGSSTNSAAPGSTSAAGPPDPARPR